MAILEKTIRNKNFDKLLRKLEKGSPTAAGLQIWKQAVTFRRAVPGAASGCLNATVCWAATA